MTDTPEAPEVTEESAATGGRPGAVVVVGPDGRPIGTVGAGAAGGAEDDAADPEDPSRLIEQPAKVMRIGSMIKQLLEEVRAAPLDEASRQRLREIHQRSITELEDGLAPELREELERISLPFEDGATPSEGELRVAQAQLVGWLEGLFHGIQAALMAQQMAARLQLEQMRTGGRQALPVGPGGMIPGMPGQPGQPGQPGEGGTRTGQYL
ncbi:bacterial proteasome activator family protein [Solwaraspora sp. WMMD791]|uniref:bacterial proteasome activator family protein n=1 Tax=Solwaraspora sp. WMMD791 TaxID=3016086 RepID=UPI00249A9D7C|nr:bacterial proteasome activator family protein [Solwaraspora sp. WMMD791]WFE25595.1 bacterial proteasome activator family protein [Solwaraspora sp. WMMD791]